jgi:hypothetical protein
MTFGSIAEQEPGLEEVLRALGPQAVRQGDIRAALQRDKGVSLAFTSIRHCAWTAGSSQSG